LSLASFSQSNIIFTGVTHVEHNLGVSVCGQAPCLTSKYLANMKRIAKEQMPLLIWSSKTCKYNKEKSLLALGTRSHLPKKVSVSFVVDRTIEFFKIHMNTSEFIVSVYV
jgi:hypothetical protein